MKTPPSRMIQKRIEFSQHHNNFDLDSVAKIAVKNDQSVVYTNSQEAKNRGEF